MEDRIAEAVITATYASRQGPTTTVLQCTVDGPQPDEVVVNGLVYELTAVRIPSMKELELTAPEAAALLRERLLHLRRAR